MLTVHICVFKGISKYFNLAVNTHCYLKITKTHIKKWCPGNNELCVADCKHVAVFCSGSDETAACAQAAESW